ncbi:MAG: MGMT family protein, partial [Cyanobacteria bacterium J06629_2]
TYRQILKCIGVDKSYFRAIPSYLRKAPPNYPLHRVLDSQGRITAHVPQQREQLEAEGIKLEQANSLAISWEKFVWQHDNIY